MDYRGCTPTYETPDFPGHNAYPCSPDSFETDAYYGDPGCRSDLMKNDLWNRSTLIVKGSRGLSTYHTLQ